MKHLLLHLILAGMLMMPVSALAQQRSVTVHGTVRDEKGAPLLGATVSIRGTAIGTIAAEDGRYRLENASPGDVMIVSYVGYTNREFTLSADALQNIDIKLDGNNLIDDVVVVAFGTQKKESIVSSISTISPKELRVPSSNLTTALAGRISGVIAYQRSGEPGRDGAEFFIRGVTTFGYKKDPLILIDGVETTSQELSRLQPDDIEGFSILKDATAAALYGSRGANGVIQVQTKTGNLGRAKVAVRVENSWSMNTRNIELADPVTFMELANEAARNRSLLQSSYTMQTQPEPYTQLKIDQTRAGADPYRFPAVDWREMLMKDFTNNQRVNMSVSGGGNVARYYVSGTFNQDNGNLKVDRRNNFNSNINLKSYQVRSNVNINLTKSTEMIVRASGTFDDYIGPRDGGEGTYESIMASNPVLFPAYYPAEMIPTTKHILFGNAIRGEAAADYVNPYAEMMSGYKESSKSLLDIQLEAKQDFGFLTEGLKGRAMFNTSRYSYFDLSRAYTPYYYGIGSLNTDGTYNLGLLNQSSNPTEYLGYYPGWKDIDTTSYLEAALEYGRTFSEKHAVSGLLIYYTRNKLYANKNTLQESLPFRNQGLSGRFTYGYDSRYLIELNFGYNGSERFHRKERYGFFPAAGAAWVVSNEKFWGENLKRVIRTVKLRASYGVVGNDQIGEDKDRFFYLSEMNMSQDRGYGFGELMEATISGSDNWRTIRMLRYANDDITWERSYKANFGLEMNLLNCIDLELEYFREKRTNILMTRENLPSTMGLVSPVRANLGKARSEGVDASIDVNKAWSSGWWVQARANFTYATSRYLEYEEPEYAEKYKSRIGWPVSQWEGLIAERLFIDQADVDNSPRQTFGEYGPGDIKYVDVNGDGQITSLDRVPLGYPTTPEIVYGFGFSFGKKKWDFSAFFQGSARSSFWIDSGGTAPFVHDTRWNPDKNRNNRGDHPLLQAYADNHWSEQNRDIYALWPRLSTEFTWNNMETSSWFMRNGAFLRLKNVEVGYTFDLVRGGKANNPTLRLYASGTNLLLISGFDLWDIEMGGRGLGYPIQSTLNLGAQFNF